MTKALVGISEAQQNITFARLEASKLVTVNRDPSGRLLSLDTHPLLREYFARERRTQHHEAWRAAHRRLYEHLSTTTKEGDEPTLEDLQPLYQAVAHGCMAGLQREACEDGYFSRILRGDENYSARKLGAFGSNLGAVACFFETPWNRVSPALKDADHAWLLNEAAISLRALGRLTEAIEPMRAGIGGAVKLEDWTNAAIYSSNLSELELTLGEVEQALGDAKQSLTYADRGGREFYRLAFRATYADALYQAGRRTEAEARFREAELMQAERQPDFPLLYSLRGFKYCDLLLTEAERAAWQTLLRSNLDPEAHSENRPAIQGDADLAFHGHLSAAASAESCRAVSQRAADTRKRRTENPTYVLLDIALDYLTLGRAGLCMSILEKSEIRNPKSEIDEAVSGLRRAGTTHHVPRGLLARAWLRSLTGPRNGPESAQSDLDEAWEIAERGPMKLFLADIHLHRARLFFRERIYPWKSPLEDLAAAEKLINECGYHRRDEELADAKRAILGL